MAKRTKKKKESWEEIGKTVGKKFEKDFKGKECASWKKPWMFCHPHQDGGFVGRLVFIIGLVYALKYLGVLVGVPTWSIILMVIGFALMKF